MRIQRAARCRARNSSSSVFRIEQLLFITHRNGGHNANPLVRRTRGHPAGEPENGSDTTYLDKNPVFADTEPTLEKYDDHEYGYLRVTADKKRLCIASHQA